MDRLFVIFDTSSDGQLNFREFASGLAPLINEDLASVLKFAFELYDMDGNGRVTREEMAKVLSALNRTVGGVGDKSLSHSDIGELLERQMRPLDRPRWGKTSPPSDQRRDCHAF